MTQVIVVESKNIKNNGMRAVNDAMREGLLVTKPFRVHRERHKGSEFFVFEQTLQN